MTLNINNNKGLIVNTGSLNDLYVNQVTLEFCSQGKGYTQLEVMPVGPSHVIAYIWLWILQILASNLN